MATENNAPLPLMQKGIRLHAPYNVQLDDISVPQIEHPHDVIVKVLLAGLCGSDLHPYRGLESKDMPPFVMGHELYGEIVRLGSSFTSAGAVGVANKKRPKGYATYRIGMKVIATFSYDVSNASKLLYHTLANLETKLCGIRYCAQGFTSRCIHSELLGSPTLPGAQAQYIRIPKSGGTLIQIQTASTSPSNNSPDGVANARAERAIPPEISILLADILPTGNFAALQAYQHPNLAFTLGSGVEGLVNQAYAEEATDVPKGGPTGVRVMTFAVIGLGPVGVCALVALIDFLLLHLNASQLSPQAGNDATPKRMALAFRVMAIDLLESRSVQAQDVIRKIQDSRISVSKQKEPGTLTIPDLGSMSQPIHIEFLSPDQAPSNTCHAVLEVVGHPSTLTLSASLSRPFGIISSVGVHSHPTFPLAAPLLYDKNLSFAFGRCPVRALFLRSKGVLERRKAAFQGFVERVVGIEEARAAYQRFEKGEGGKVCFDPWK